MTEFLQENNWTLFCIRLKLNYFYNGETFFETDLSMFIDPFFVFFQFYKNATQCKGKESISIDHANQVVDASYYQAS